MHTPKMNRAGVLLAVAALALGACQGSKGAPGSNGTDGSDGSNGTNGIPGLTSSLKIAVTGVTTNADNTISVRFTMKDSRGAPVDAAGVYSTNAAFTPAFSLAYVSQDADGNVLPYTVLTVKSGSPSSFTPGTGTGTMVENGTGAGDYTFTFPAAVAYDATKLANTHTLWIQATRKDLNGAILGVVNAEYNYVPSTGAKVDGQVREIVSTAGCSKCHDGFSTGSFHGGGRIDAKYCDICHNPARSNAAANAMVFVHRIHDSAALVQPTPVTTGTQTTGYQGANSCSATKPCTCTVANPCAVGGNLFHNLKVTYPQSILNCGACHDGAAQGDQWETRPTQAACGSCHDTVSFTDPAPTGTTLHSGGAQADDRGCVTCHGKTATLAVAKYHGAGVLPKATVDFAITAVTIDPGTKIPTIAFTVKENGSTARDLTKKAFESFGATWAGPTTAEFTINKNVKIQSTSSTGTVTTDPGLDVTDAANGNYKFTFPASAAVPDATAAGSYGFALEGNDANEARASGNPVVYVNGDGTTAPARRTIVDTAKCNACHNGIGAHHAANRQNAAQYCAFCHNPVTAQSRNVAQTQLDPVTGTTTRVGQSIELSVMIHKIHTGEASQDPSWAYYGYPSNAALGGAPLERATFPGNRMDCAQCHVTGTYGLPLNAAVYPTSKSTQFVCNDTGTLSTSVACTTKLVGTDVTTPRTAAICTACHDSIATVTHAQLNTLNGVESCDVCHGAGAAYDVKTVH